MIRDLIDNYIKQEKIYQKIELSSIQQTLLLQNQTLDPLMIKEVLQQRQALMDDVAAINEEAKKIQEKMKRDYGLKSFTVSEIEGVVNNIDLLELKQALENMSEVLKQISQNDLRNQTLMRQAAAESHTGPSVSNQQATNAYRQSMDRKNSQ
ncbi:MAG: hypothetical protein GXY34_10845 [Syntrophomonadaceae bacterium]|nr:hypothetical protein [Syntrophomonadaceae bacterium]